MDALEGPSEGRGTPCPMEDRVLGELPSDDAYRLVEDLRHSCRRLRQEWVRLAAHLHQVQLTRAWKTLGYEDMNDLLQEPEINIGRRYAYQLVEAYRTMVVEHGVDPAQLARADITKVREVLPAVRRGVIGAQQAVADAMSLRRVDLIQQYKQDPTSTIDPEQEPLWQTCSSCGSRYMVRRGLDQ